MNSAPHPDSCRPLRPTFTPPSLPLRSHLRLAEWTSRCLYMQFGWSQIATQYRLHLPPTMVTSTAVTPRILFTNATIVSGEDDAVPYEADALMSDGIIKAIGKDLERDRSMFVIDATGCYLTPGFIDMHAHSDLYLLTHPEHEAKISQGCTVSCGWIGTADKLQTEVVGQDGISYYPIRQSHEMTAVREQIAGWNGNPTIAECGCGGHLEGIGMFQWNSVGEYLDCLEKNKTATNVAVLVPQVRGICEWG